MDSAAGAVFLFDVDNTLLDNDRIQHDLRERLQAAHGERVCARYWEIFEEQWGAVDYADYFGALERLNSNIAMIGRSQSPPTGLWTIRSPIASIPRPSTQ